MSERKREEGEAESREIEILRKNTRELDIWSNGNQRFYHAFLDNKGFGIDLPIQIQNLVMEYIFIFCENKICRRVLSINEWSYNHYNLVDHSIDNGFIHSVFDPRYYRRCLCESCLHVKIEQTISDIDENKKCTIENPVKNIRSCPICDKILCINQTFMFIPNCEDCLLPMVCNSCHFYFHCDICEQYKSRCKFCVFNVKVCIKCHDKYNYTDSIKYGRNISLKK